MHAAADGCHDQVLYLLRGSETGVMPTCTATLSSGTDGPMRLWQQLLS